MDRRSWTLLLALAAIWGASYMLIKIGLRDLSPGMVACLRVAFAALVIAPIALRRDAFRGLGGVIAVLVLVGAVQVAGPFLLIGLGEQEISSALAGILVATAPIFTALLAIWVDHEERSQGMRLGGIAIGIAGVALLFGLDLSDSGNALLGGLAIVLASLGYAVGGFVVKHRLSDLDPLGMTVSVMTASTLLLAPLAIATAPSDFPDLGPLAAVAALGAFGTGLAFVIFYGLIARVGPAKSFLVAYLAPGFAVVYGAALLDETITAATVAGLLLILAGSWLAAEGRLPLRGRRAAPGDRDVDGRELPAGDSPVAKERGGTVPVLSELAPKRVQGR
jgi:drug/metabolite transporter (DMT)-like permease